MINTLCMLYDDDDLVKTLKTFPLAWQGNDLICGNYIVAKVWNLDIRPLTWRTAFCGAHNSAFSVKEGKEHCETYIKERVSKYENP